MGLFDSIGSALGKVVQHTPIEHAAKFAAKVVHDPGGAAIDAVREGAHMVRSAKRVVVSGARRVHRAASAAIRDARAGAHAIGRRVKAVGAAAAAGATVAGKWAWRHRAEIGMWVGSAALLAAVPVTGGASGALAGGLLAGRAGALAARVAPGAIKGARAGAAMLRTSRTATRTLHATRGAKSVLRAQGSAVHARRAKLGATRAGRAIAAAQKPLGRASLGLAGVNVADHSQRLARGTKDASWKDLGLSSLGLAPGVAMGSRAVTRTRVAKNDVAAARTVAESLPEVRAKATHALRATDDIAASAPQSAEQVRVATARTLAGAASAERTAVRNLNSERPVDERAADLLAIKSQVESVAHAARTATVRAAAAPVAPARAAEITRKLDDAAAQADDVSRRLDEHLAHRESLEHAIKTVSSIEAKTGNVSLSAGLANNTTTVVVDPQRAPSTAFGGLTLGSLSALLTRNASLRAGTTAPYSPR